MAIVSMKRLRLIGFLSDRNTLFDQLQHIGCVEISEQPALSSDSDWENLLQPSESTRSEKERMLEETAAALDALKTYAPEKSSLLSALPQITEQALFDQRRIAEAMLKVRMINSYAAELQADAAEIQRLNVTCQSLLPWRSLDIPLSTGSTGSCCVAFGMLPASVDLSAVRAELQTDADASELYEASTDAEAHYLLFFCHRSQEDTAMDALKSYGFSTTTFKGITGTAEETIAYLHSQQKTLSQKLESLKETLASFAASRMELKLCYDRLSQEIQKESCKERLIRSEKTFFLEGWLPESSQSQLETLLASYDCACELKDPEPEEYPEVPVKLKNSVLSRCMNVVTEMYSLPAYDGVDPNPLMAPFFILFFGMMMADMGYGLLMIIAALVVLRKTRPRESTRNFMEGVLFCGISTFIVGALTGGFFGDFIPQLLKIINPDSTFTMPALFTPLDDTVAILLGSLILGVIQVITGMIISVVKKCRDGHVADAVWDECTWWIILIGLALFILDIGNVRGVPVVLIVGGVMLLYGGSRNARGFGKVTALVGVIYNGVTGYFSDILSYLRLMALMLSGSVIAQVFNTLGAVFGNVIIFIIISMIGNALNLALNLLGCYVHDLRLQCLEFFNRFYKEGGKPYAPLSIQTKYVDIIKEES